MNKHERPLPEVTLIGGERLRDLNIDPDVRLFLADVALRAFLYRDQKKPAQPRLLPTLSTFTITGSADNELHLYGAHQLQLANGVIKLGETSHKLTIYDETVISEEGSDKHTIPVLVPEDGSFPIACATVQDKTIFHLLIGAAQQDIRDAHS